MSEIDALKILKRRYPSAAMRLEVRDLKARIKDLEKTNKQLLKVIEITRNTLRASILAIRRR